MVLQHTAGEKLFIDFAGTKLSYIDPQTGQVIYCQVFVACLPYSDYSFALAVKSQCVEDFIYALGCCLHELGGVPHPEQLYKTCDGLLSLQRKTDPDIFSKACLMAIEHKNLSYKFILNILNNKMTGQQETKQEQPLPNRTNIRGKEYYTQSTLKFKSL